MKKENVKKANRMIKTRIQKIEKKDNKTDKKPAFIDHNLIFGEDNWSW